MLKLIQDVANDGDEAYATVATGFCEATEVGVNPSPFADGVWVVRLTRIASCL